MSNTHSRGLDAFSYFPRDSHAIKMFAQRFANVLVTKFEFILLGKPLTLLEKSLVPVHIKLY